MPRKKREKKSPEEKRELRRRKRELKRKMREEGGLVIDPGKEERDRTAHEENQSWAGIRGRMRASKLLSEATNWKRPWWLSIRYEAGTPPLCYYYPCSMFRRGNRWYYGFLFRDQRDALFKDWSKKHPRYRIRKELTL